MSVEIDTINNDTETIRKNRKVKFCQKTNIIDIRHSIEVLIATDHRTPLNAFLLC